MLSKAKQSSGLIISTSTAAETWPWKVTTFSSQKILTTPFSSILQLHSNRSIKASWPSDNASDLYSECIKIKLELSRCFFTAFYNPFHPVLSNWWHLFTFPPFYHTISHLTMQILMQNYGITIKNKPTHSNTHNLTAHTQALVKC
jgi:hypothetical protein